MNVRRIVNASFLLLSLTLTSVPFAPAQTGGQPSLAEIRAACQDDAQKLCAGVQAGGGRIIACLKDRKDSLSERCKQAAGLASNPGGSSAPNAITSPLKSPGSVNGSSTSLADPATKSAAIWSRHDVGQRNVCGTRHHGYGTRGDARGDHPRTREVAFREQD